MGPRSDNLGYAGVASATLHMPMLLQWVRGPITSVMVRIGKQTGSNQLSFHPREVASERGPRDATDQTDIALLPFRNRFTACERPSTAEKTPKYRLSKNVAPGQRLVRNLPPRPSQGNGRQRRSPWPRPNGGARS